MTVTCHDEPLLWRSLGELGSGCRSGCRKAQMRSTGGWYVAPSASHAAMSLSVHRVDSMTESAEGQASGRLSRSHDMDDWQCQSEMTERGWRSERMSRWRRCHCDHHYISA